MEELQSHLDSLVKAINFCRKNGLFTPGLILIYSLIDIMGSLIRRRGEKAGSSFKRWVSDYLLKAKSLPCSAVDLYAARCGILHALTPDSDLSNKGKAKRISYAWGKSSVNLLKKLYADHTNKEIALHVDDLFDALILGIDLFLHDIEKNSQLENHVKAKVRKLFALIPYSLKSPK